MIHDFEILTKFQFFPVFIIANNRFDFTFIQDKSKFIGSIRWIDIDKNQSSFCGSKLKGFQNDAESRDVPGRPVQRTPDADG